VVDILKKANPEQNEGMPPPDHEEGSNEYWAAQITESRSIISSALNPHIRGQNEETICPDYIQDPQLLLEYWAARTAEARARVEERLALALLNIHMDIAIKESGDAIRRLESALEGSSKTVDSLLHGPWVF
jgi:hypothetical protein